jgi:hypothetical protein
MKCKILERGSSMFSFVAKVCVEFLNPHADTVLYLQDFYFMFWHCRSKDRHQTMISIEQ